MVREFEREYPDYCRKAVLRARPLLRKEQSGREQIGLFTQQLNRVVSEDEAHDMTLITLAEISPTEFDVAALESLFCFFAGVDQPSSCRTGLAMFLRVVNDLRGEDLLQVAVRLLLNASPDVPAADGGSAVGDTVYDLSVVDCD